MELMEDAKVIKAEAIDKIQSFIMIKSELYFTGVLDEKARQSKG